VRRVAPVLLHQTYWESTEEHAEYEFAAKASQASQAFKSIWLFVAHETKLVRRQFGMA
jgi:hypothetical protein